MLQKLLSLFASEMKNNKRVAMIEEFIDSVLIIDDSKNEVEGLIEVLEKRDIWITYLKPPKEKQQIDRITKPYRNRQLIFLDLRIDETKKTIDNISTIIRPLLSKIISNDFGSYGIVMWTKHEKHISEFKEKIQKDANRYQMPLFVVKMDKSKYLRNGFNNILTDLNIILKNSIAANFFINWSNLVQKSKDKAISSIYELVPDYEKQDKNLEFLLFKIAQNYTGIPFEKIDTDYSLSVDAVKAFNELLVYEINSSAELLNFLNEKKEISYKKNDGNYVQPVTRISKIGNELIELYANLNTKLLIDEVNIKQDIIVPGNVYEIKDITSKLKHPDLPDGATPIVIEMTPPCDFSNDKTKYPRILSGFIMKWQKKKDDDGNELDEPDFKDLNKYKSEKYYSEIWPIKITNKNRIIIFDFSILGFVDKKELKNENKYKLLFRVKDKLFADILQKMSAYTARLGLSIIR